MIGISKVVGKGMIPVANVYTDEKDAKAVYDVIKSGWLSKGPVVEKFEKEFKKSVGSKNAICVNSGTSALHAVLAALNIGKDDEVILPSLTFISTANAVLYQNATPVLVECDPRTYNITPEEIEKNITKKTKAVITVDMNGMPVDYNAIMDTCESHSLHLIADSAESLGSTYKNKKVGGIAPIHCFSFFPNKNITTGEGGMITTNDTELAEKIRIIINQGQDYRYHHVVLGYNYRMTDIQAALGITQLKRLSWILKEKEKIARNYNKAFESAKNIKPPFVPDYVTKHAWYMYAIRVGGNRDKIVEQLKRKGIETRLSFPPIHVQPLYKKLFNYTNDSLPVTYNAWSRLIDIPIWAGMRNEQQEHVINTLLDLCGKEK